MEGWPSKRFLSKHESVLSPDVWKWLFNSSTCERSTLQTLINSISSFSLTIKGGNFLPHYENKFNARESVDVKMSCCSEAEQSRDRNRDGGQKSRESTPLMTRSLVKRFNTQKPGTYGIITTAADFWTGLSKKEPRARLYYILNLDVLGISNFWQMYIFFSACIDSKNSRTRQITKSNGQHKLFKAHWKMGMLRCTLGKIHHKMSEWNIYLRIRNKRWKQNLFDFALTLLFSPFIFS